MAGIAHNASGVLEPASYLHSALEFSLKIHSIIIA
jgi:hypothetical protein